MTAAMAPWPEAVEIDTRASPEQTLTRALAVVHPPGMGVSWCFQQSRMEPG